MADLVRLGAQAIILGCTEISLLVVQSDAEVPLFDTTSIHARKAAECALANEAVSSAVALNFRPSRNSNTG
jgi:aspartate racemase